MYAIRALSPNRRANPLKKGILPSHLPYLIAPISPRILHCESRRILFLSNAPSIQNIDEDENMEELEYVQRLTGAQGMQNLLTMAHGNPPSFSSTTSPAGPTEPLTAYLKPCESAPR